MIPSVTPLRYPGGKTWLLGYVKRFLNFYELAKLDYIIEPYAGSASVSIGLLEANLTKEAILCEKDVMISSFLQSVKDHDEELTEFVRTVEVSLKTWFSYRKYLSSDACNRYSQIDLAKAFLFYNRTNYSGIIAAGPLGGRHGSSKYGIDCRFTREKIVEKIKRLKGVADRIQIVQGDGLEFMRKLSSKPLSDRSFFYVDPPYFVAGKDLYRHFLMPGEHIALSDFLKRLDVPWLLSYDDVQFIRDLYGNFRWQPVYVDHQVGPFKKGVQELLVSNLRIPPTMFTSLSISKSRKQHAAESYGEQQVLSTAIGRL